MFRLLLALACSTDHGAGDADKDEAPAVVPALGSSGDPPASLEHVSSSLATFSSLEVIVGLSGETSTGVRLYSGWYLVLLADGRFAVESEDGGERYSWDGSTLTRHWIELDEVWVEEGNWAWISPAFAVLRDLNSGIWQVAGEPDVAGGCQGHSSWSRRALEPPLPSDAELWFCASDTRLNRVALLWGGNKVLLSFGEFNFDPGLTEADVGPHASGKPHP